MCVCVRFLNDDDSKKAWIGLYNVDVFSLNCNGGSMLIMKNTFLKETSNIVTKLEIAIR